MKFKKRVWAGGRRVNGGNKGKFVRKAYSSEREEMETGIGASLWESDMCQVAMYSSCRFPCKSLVHGHCRGGQLLFHCLISLA